MSKSSDDSSYRENLRRNQPLVYMLNRLVIVTAIGTIIGLLLSAIVSAFAVGPETGLRSLAAAALPPIVLTYSNFFSPRRSAQSSQRVLEVNLFAIALIWILLLLILVDFVTRQFNHTIPLGEFVISLTLSALISAMRIFSMRSLLSCSYGILSGFLLYLLIFGMPQR
jgi:uncharacterized membrane protein